MLLLLEVVMLVVVVGVVKILFSFLKELCIGLKEERTSHRKCDKKTFSGCIQIITMVMVVMEFWLSQ